MPDNALFDSRLPALGTSWNVLREAGPGDELVLAVDFDVTGRPEARFADLAPALPDGFGMWETVPPQVSLDDGLTGREYVAIWGDGLPDDLPRVAAVAGFCIGGVYAAELVRVLGERQGEAPALFLVDPELASAESVSWQFQKVIEFMAGMATETEIADALAAGRRAAQQAGGDLVALARGLCETFGDIGRQVLPRGGLDSVSQDELFRTFGSFMSYLSAAGSLPPFDVWRDAVALTSTSPNSGLNGIRAHRDQLPDPSAELVGREIQMHCEHVAMLRDSAVAGVLGVLLRGHE